VEVKLVWQGMGPNPTTTNPRQKLGPKGMTRRFQAFLAVFK